MDPLSAAINGVANIGSSLITNHGNKKAQQRARAHDINMWDKTNAYNDPKSQMERLRNAGLNPNMVYGGSSGQTAGQANALPGAKAPDIKNIETRQPLMDYVQVKNTEAQTENVRSMQSLNDANAYKTYDDILSNQKNRNKTDQEIANLKSLRDGIGSDNKYKRNRANMSDQGRYDGNESILKQEWNKFRKNNPNMGIQEMIKKVAEALGITPQQIANDLIDSIPVNTMFRN